MENSGSRWNTQCYTRSLTAQRETGALQWRRVWGSFVDFSVVFFNFSVFHFFKVSMFEIWGSKVRGLNFFNFFKKAQLSHFFFCAGFGFPSRVFFIYFKAKTRSTFSKMKKLSENEKVEKVEPFLKFSRFSTFSTFSTFQAGRSTFSTFSSWALFKMGAQLFQLFQLFHF